MIQVPVEVRREMRLLAASEGRPVSDLYVEAARAYLAARERVVTEPTPIPAAPAREAPVSDPSVSAALARQEKALGEIGRKLDLALRPEGRLAGAVTARAIAVTLAALTRAGPDGETPGTLNKACAEQDLDMNAAMDARSFLRNAGLVQFKANRWFLRSPEAGSGSG
ncbi:hypothetical protein Maq22A_c12955 [Methylobacterium aquaticum]|uniref:Uncharacterized protein n=2 Tax=Methylobacterium aquaticum TaxID=270351 RepID=A0A0C6FSM7_9HYPH|nr:hypothetical protein Maq22A_c12955 [Methylobacterium aquaticum]